MILKYVRAKTPKEVEAIYNYTIDAFSDTPDFSWTLDEIKKEIKEKWELFGVENEDKDIIAAIFVRESEKSLETKNTGLKINHQGSGYNHEIKEKFEEIARERKCKEIFHYCRIDNFRMYSLNESHGYKKTKNTSQDGQVVEWRKKL